MGPGPEREVVVELYRAHYERMVRLAWLLTGSSPAAEELVQDVFVRLMSRQRAMENPTAYLRAAVVNACRNERRRRRLERHRMPDPPPSTELAVDHIRSLIAGLPWPQRAAIVLRYYEDLTQADIAAHLDCPVGTVKSHLHRGLARLREVVDQ